MSTWFAVLELPFLLLATVFAFLTARAIKSSIIWRGITFIALGSLVMAVGHIIMIVNGLFEQSILNITFGVVGGAWAWLLALCSSWIFYGLGFYEIYRELPEGEEALRYSERRYRSLIEAAPDVIYTLSANGKITSVNPAFEAGTGWP